MKLISARFREALNKNKLSRILFIALTLTVLSCGGPKNGLEVKKYYGSWTYLPDFDGRAPASTYTVAQVVADTQETKDYGLVMTGNIYLERTGNYRFFLQSDDGSKLYLDNQEVINNDGLHNSPHEAASAPLELERGDHPIRIEYFRKGNGNKLSLFMQYGSEPKQSVSGNILYLPGFGGDSGQGGGDGGSGGGNGNNDCEPSTETVDGFAGPCYCD